MASMSACFSPTPKTRSFPLTRKPFNPSQFHYFTLLPSPALIRPSKSRSVSLIRASSVDVTATSGIRPGGAVESDKLPSDVRKRAMDAIDSSGLRVTVGDVASKAGLKLNEAQRALQALAADTDGFLEVSDEGDVLYVFPKDYRSKLTAKSFKIKFEPLVEKGKTAAEYLVRVSFGTALIASIVIVYTTIIAIASSSRESDDRGRRGRSYGSGVNFYFNPTDLFWYWDLNYYRRRRARESDGGMNFIESVFSVVFGDGDPNQGIEEERWKLIYTSSFFAIPLIRWLFVQNKNAKIVQRNLVREQRAMAIESPDLSLRRKLLSARDMAQRTFIGQDRIVYSTERDLNEQDYDSQDWDRRFKELEKSD